MINVKLSKQAPPLTCSRDCGRKNEKIAVTCTDPNAVPRYHNCHMCPWHHKCSVPLALLEFSAPGTLGKFTVQSSSSQVGPGTTSLDRLPVGSGMIVELPSSLWGSSLSPCSPWERSGLWLYWSQHPPLVTEQSPPALLVCVMGSCTVWCQPVGHTANVIHSLVFFCWEKSFFVWLSALAIGWLTCASWCFLLSVGCLAMSPSSWVSHLWVWDPVHLPWAPHWVPELGCHRFTTPFRRVAHALGPQQWTNNSTGLLGMK